MGELGKVHPNLLSPKSKNHPTNENQLKKREEKPKKLFLPLHKNTGLGLLTTSLGFSVPRKL